MSPTADLPGALPRARDLTEALVAAWDSRGAGYRPRTRHLLADGAPRFTNRLLLQASPYLRQHAHNPVDWRPWSDEAFAEAAERGVPVLLSVGYATCHWCHVMEEESFEDPEIAEVINRSYVPIKVDREERPDVDAVYMAAVQALTGRGGWPMTVWLTPEREPWYGGTYYPARDGDRGSPTGFLTLLQHLSGLWGARRVDVVAEAARLSQHVRASLSARASGGSLPGRERLEVATAYFQRAYDPRDGGVGSAPKFPSSLPVRLLLREHARTGEAALLQMATHSLRRMAEGGMRDQLGGAFHRYAVDRRWLVPHFEKMLYDNALLVPAYLEGAQASGDEALIGVAVEVLEDVLRTLTCSEGGFWSATDADSLDPSGKLEEGRSFTWTPEELAMVLGPEEARLVGAWFGVDRQGHLDGRSVLHTGRPLSALAPQLGVSEVHLRRAVERARPILLRARSQRPQPLLDDKVLAGWNGLMISAFARAARALGRPRYLAVAQRAADFTLRALRPDGRLLRSWRGGVRGHQALMEDYAFVIAGMIDLFEGSADLRWLELAVELDREVEARFEDAEGGGWYATASDHEVLLARERPSYDGAVPTGASVHLLSLLRLASLTGQDRYRRRADAGLASLDLSHPWALSEALLALSRRHSPTAELLIVCPSDRGEGAPLLDAVRGRFLPHLTALVVPSCEVERLARLVPWAEGRAAIDGRPTAYLCEDGVCALPIRDAEGLGAALERLGVR
ncbi:MAG: thioredoxin domain-containing protein [Deltaproteobacteria bacterium]|nr:thioredoxin domain-containing protein [Deltaproteobacteria bacterium]